ncbi:uncharacterized protein LOC135087312 [Ostrinia nubilalis]|uniref:uncharacterized protein LOC135087312 n=1 Tax=Ostrinia nubilalis TaxID=29057 RepID=UPI0030825310
MAARRGTPKIIFSDNGTNFVGANRELQGAASREGITWRFIPPGCPNMGGAWERMVRSVKTSLMTVLKEKSPPEEVLHTLLLEVEHIVNSRPLTHINPAPGVFEDHDLIGKANWRTAQRLTDHFWQRWLKEYLPTLMPRKIAGRETEDPQVGDVVLIVDATLPRNTWPRGEVLRVYPGPDGRIRILDVRTPGGVLRRPTRRVVVLVPAKTSHPEEGVLRTAGENGWKGELDKAFHHVHTQQKELKEQIASASLKIAELENDRTKLQQELNTQAQSFLRTEIEIAGMAESPRENLFHNVLVIAQRVGVKLEDRDIDSVTRVEAPRRSLAGTTSTDLDGGQSNPPSACRGSLHATRDT